ncbi:MAG TPA: SRPBCC family protein [Candidatus Limnocylindrales bacterium]|jgi:ribosome-associated toxin RatA of RatAB toxin-antitoxin module|nr:SRPBCC family protein [Candidatus Limnocylindrales bacterium]
MRSTLGIDVAAPPALVFALARDPERWARLLPHYTRSRAVGVRRSDGSLVVAFIARRPLVDVLGLALPVTWRARTWAEPATLRLRFVHLAGATSGMDVTWRIEPAPGGARVEIEHDFRPAVPLLAAVVDRFFTRPIAGRTLATFRDLAEAVASSTLDGAAESGRPPDANPPA